MSCVGCNLVNANFEGQNLSEANLTGQAGSPALYPLRMSIGMKAVRVASRNEKRDDDCLPDNSNKRSSWEVGQA
jgi:Pentapeptide repeats (8 copies)